MGEEFVSLDEAVSISGLSTEELEKRIADGALRSFLQKRKQVFRREDILKLKYEEVPEEEVPEEKVPEEEAPAEEAEGIMELLEEGQELSLVPEEEKAAPIEVPGLEEVKKEEKAEEETEVVFEADEELKVEPAVEETSKEPVPFKEVKEEAEEEAPTEAPTFAAEVLEEMEEAGEELGVKEVKELAEREEAPEYVRARLQPAVRPGFYFLLILCIIFLLIGTITLVSNVLDTPQSILEPFMKLFTG